MGKHFFDTYCDNLVESILSRSSGMVYKGVDKTTGREVAVKIFNDEEDFDIDREIDFLVKMVSPFIVSLLEAVNSNSQLWVSFFTF